MSSIRCCVCVCVPGSVQCRRSSEVQSQAILNIGAPSYIVAQRSWMSTSDVAMKIPCKQHSILSCVLHRINAFLTHISFVVQNLQMRYVQLIDWGNGEAIASDLWKQHQCDIGEGVNEVSWGMGHWPAILGMTNCRSATRITVSKSVPCTEIQKWGGSFWRAKVDQATYSSNISDVCLKDVSLWAENDRKGWMQHG